MHFPTRGPAPSSAATTEGLGGLGGGTLGEGTLHRSEKEHGDLLRAAGVSRGQPTPDLVWRGRRRRESLALGGRKGGREEGPVTVLLD